MASARQRLSDIVKELAPFRPHRNLRAINTLVSARTAKWMQDTSKKSPMESMRFHQSKLKAELQHVEEIVTAIKLWLTSNS